MRERDSTLQIRGKIDDIVGALRGVVEGKKEWSDLVIEFGKYEQVEIE
jgi:hypothetical protein